MLISTSKPWSDPEAMASGGMWSSMATIKGKAGVGEVLSVETPNGFTFSVIQWFRNGSAIPGAYENTYTQTVDDVPTPGHPVKITAEISGLTTTTNEFVITG